MNVSELMVMDPVTIPVTANIEDAIGVMKSCAIRHLPVVDDGRKLMGLVTLAGLREGLLPSMLGDVTLSDIMVNNPVSLHPEDDVERAARRIYQYKVSGMPVVDRENRLVGILTETDILRAFIDMMGFLHTDVRVDAVLDDDPDAFHQAFRIIRDGGGILTNITMSPAKDGKRPVCFRLEHRDTAAIRQSLEAAGIDVIRAAD